MGTQPGFKELLKPRGYPEDPQNKAVERKSPHLLPNAWKSEAGIASLGRRVGATQGYSQSRGARRMGERRRQRERAPEATAWRQAGCPGLSTLPP